MSGRGTEKREPSPERGSAAGRRVREPRESSRRAREPEVAEDASAFRVEDRRHWADASREEAGEPASAAAPTVLDEFRLRAEQAESKLQEYIDAFRTYREEQEAFRARLSGDVDRRVDLRFGELVAELLTAVDDLELALAHVADVPEAAPLAEGVGLARDRFLAALERQGVTRITPTGEPFDPNESEAMRVEPVEDAGRDGRVVETLQPGYRLGERVIRAARVAVGRHTPPSGGD